MPRLIADLLRYSTEELKDEIRRREIEESRRLERKRRNEVIVASDANGCSSKGDCYCQYCR